MTIWRPTKNILLALPEELLVEIDEAAKSKYMSRIEYIRYALNKQVGGQYREAIDLIRKDDPARLLDLDDS